MARASKCRDCRTMLPLECPFFRIQLPPEEVVCRGCGKVIATTFAHRRVWMGQQVFRISWFVCTLGIFVSCALHGTALLACAVLAVVGGLFIGGVAGSIAGTVLAPLLARVLGTAKRPTMTEHDVLGHRRYVDASSSPDSSDQDSPPLEDSRAADYSASTEETLH